MGSYWIVGSSYYDIIKTIFAFNILFCIKPSLTQAVYVTKPHVYLGVCHFV